MHLHFPPKTSFLPDARTRTHLYSKQIYPWRLNPQWPCRVNCCAWVSFCWWTPWWRQWNRRWPVHNHNPSCAAPPADRADCSATRWEFKLKWVNRISASSHLIVWNFIRFRFNNGLRMGRKYGTGYSGIVGFNAFPKVAAITTYLQNSTHYSKITIYPIREYIPSSAWSSRGWSSICRCIDSRNQQLCICHHD